MMKKHIKPFVGITHHLLKRMGDLELGGMAVATAPCFSALVWVAALNIALCGFTMGEGGAQS